MRRRDLEVEVFYRLPNGVVFLTPDGFGGWWYESLGGAVEQHGELEIINIDEIPEED